MTQRIIAAGQRRDVKVRVHAVIDPDPAKARAFESDDATPVLADHYARFDNLADALDAGCDADAFVVGTRCNLHTPLAVQLAAVGLPIFLEKPVAISWDQLAELRRAFAAGDLNDAVVVSFPLRRTPIYIEAKRQIDAGRLGDINQISAVNYVSYGSVYVDSWYRDYDLTGGLWLQKATHDFDYIHHLRDAPPVGVLAMHTRAHWREPVLHQDAGSALVQYADGLHANYTQNFLTRRSAGRRGARITGSDATLEFDWNSDLIRLTEHTSDRVDEINVGAPSADGHGGGDHQLAEDFIDVVLGHAPSRTPLTDGLLSAATCLAARDSAHTRRVEPIPPQDGSPTPAWPRVNIEPAHPTDETRGDDVD